MLSCGVMLSWTGATAGPRAVLRLVGSPPPRHRGPGP